MYLDVCIVGIKLQVGQSLGDGVVIRIVGYPSKHYNGTFMEVIKGSKLYQGVIPIGASGGRLGYFFDETCYSAEVEEKFSSASD